MFTSDFVASLPNKIVKGKATTWVSKRANNNPVLSKPKAVP